MQQSDRNQYSYQRIDIAENGSFLARNRFEVGEIEAVGDAGVGQTEDQQAEQAFAVQYFGMQAGGGKDIGKQYGDGSDKEPSGSEEAQFGPGR